MKKLLVTLVLTSALVAGAVPGTTEEAEAYLFEDQAEAVGRTVVSTLDTVEGLLGDLVEVAGDAVPQWVKDAADTTVVFVVDSLESSYKYVTPDSVEKFLKDGVVWLVDSTGKFYQWVVPKPLREAVSFVNESLDRWPLLSAVALTAFPAVKWVKVVKGAATTEAGVSGLFKAALVSVKQEGFVLLETLKVRKTLPTSCWFFQVNCKNQLRKLKYKREEYAGKSPGWRPSQNPEFKGCSVRQEVLVVTAVVKPVVTSPGCKLTGGEWFDAFTGERLKGADQVSVDHVVSVKDAHKSGGYKWKQDEKHGFYDDPDNLVPTSVKTNSTKSDAGPDSEFWNNTGNDTTNCGYAAQFVQVKSKYGLSVTPEEKAALDEKLSSCPV